MRAPVPVSLGASLPLLLALAAPAAAQSSSPAPVVMPVSDEAAQIAALRADLVTAQQEIVRLRAIAANQPVLEAALDAARARNARLVGIANDLIAAYAKRYARGRFLPFDLARRRFEAELQATGDAVYDNRWDAGPRRVQPQSDASTPAPVEGPKADAR